MQHNPSYNIIFDLNDVLFRHQPEHRGTAQQFIVIKEMVNLLHQIHAQSDSIGKKQHQLYVLSNAPLDIHHHLMIYHTPLFSYFDGISTSGISGFKKPDIRAFLHILEKYNLKASDCIFIDDKQENVASAQSVGMIGILCTNAEQVLQELRQYQVL
jgi:HAD superfamily hydrolase (TIGR01509 family)